MVALLAASSCPAAPAADPLLPSLYKGLDWDSKYCGYKITSIDQLPLIVANIISILLALIAILAVIFVIYAGIQYITSSGDPAKTATAKSNLTNATVGVILSGGAYILVSFLASRFPNGS